MLLLVHCAGFLLHFCVFPPDTRTPFATGMQHAVLERGAAASTFLGLGGGALNLLWRTRYVLALTDGPTRCHLHMKAFGDNRHRLFDLCAHDCANEKRS